jgi:hypothetical protein
LCNHSSIQSLAVHLAKARGTPVENQWPKDKKYESPCYVTFIFLSYVSSPLWIQILTWKIFPSAINFCSTFRKWVQILHPHKTRERMTGLCISFLNVLEWMYKILKRLITGMSWVYFALNITLDINFVIITSTPHICLQRIRYNYYNLLLSHISFM